MFSHNSKSFYKMLTIRFLLPFATVTAQYQVPECCFEVVNPGCSDGNDAMMSCCESTGNECVFACTENEEVCDIPEACEDGSIPEVMLDCVAKECPTTDATEEPPVEGEVSNAYGEVKEGEVTDGYVMTPLPMSEPSTEGEVAIAYGESTEEEVADSLNCDEYENAYATLEPTSTVEPIVTLEPSTLAPTEEPTLLKKTTDNKALKLANDIDSAADMTTTSLLCCTVVAFFQLF